jgi:hypothetical protein
MKKWIILAPVLALAAAFGAVTKVNRLMKLGWNENPPAEAVAFYTVHVTGPMATNVNVFFPPVELTNLLRDFPNGEYSLSVSATGESAVRSDMSAPLAVFWYGNKPSAPTNLFVQFP